MFKMKLTLEQKIESLGQVKALCDQAVTSLYTNNSSDFQKEIVLAKRGLELIFESIKEETKEKMEKKQ